MNKYNPTNFAVGDIVEYLPSAGSFWQGGTGEIVELGDWIRVMPIDLPNWGKMPDGRVILVKLPESPGGWDGNSVRVISNKKLNICEDWS